MSKKGYILHLVGALEDYSSIRTDVLALSTGLAKLGIKSKIVTTYPILGGNTSRELGLKNKVIIKQYKYNLRLTKKYRISFSLMLTGIEGFSEQPIITHVHGPRSFEALCSLLLRKILKYPLAISTYGAIPCIGNLAMRLVKKTQDNLVLKNLLKSANIILAETIFEKNIILENYNVEEDSIYIIYEKAENIFFKTNIHPSKNNEIEILFVGRITPIKGLHTLVKAFKIVLDNMSRKESQKVKLIIIGPIEDPKYWRKILYFAKRTGIYRNIKYLGVIRHVNLPEYYARAYVTVLPSIYENIGGVIMEAMAVGCPVIASRTGGIPEIVDHMTTGLLFERGDKEDLAEKLLYVMKRSSLRAQMAKKAKEKALKVFTVDAYVRRILEAYRKAGVIT